LALHPVQAAIVAAAPNRRIYALPCSLAGRTAPHPAQQARRCTTASTLQPVPAAILAEAPNRRIDALPCSLAARTAPDPAQQARRCMTASTLHPVPAAVLAAAPNRRIDALPCSLAARTAPDTAQPARRCRTDSALHPVQAIVAAAPDRGSLPTAAHCSRDDIAPAICALPCRAAEPAGPPATRRSLPGSAGQTGFAPRSGSHRCGVPKQRIGAHGHAAEPAGPPATRRSLPGSAGQTGFAPRSGSHRCGVPKLRNGGRPCRCADRTASNPPQPARRRRPDSALHPVQAAIVPAAPDRGGLPPAARCSHDDIRSATAGATWPRRRRLCRQAAAGAYPAASRHRQAGSGHV